MDVLAISPDVLHSELEAMEAVLAKWRNAVSNGIPGLDVPSSDEHALARFLTELGGELLLVAGKCETVAGIVTERSISG